MKPLLMVFTLALAQSAMADRLPLPANTPPAYAAECGSCHLAYPPQLLAAPDWQRLMAKLDSHFGSDASLAPDVRRQLENFLATNAGSASRLGAAGDPPRISQTARFVRKHRELQASDWKNPKVRSAANCEACHTRAAEGRFSEHEIVMPGTRR